MHVSGNRTDGRSISRFPARRAYLALAIAFIAFALYGSLLPFEFEPAGVGSAWAQFKAMLFAFPSRRISRSDLLANALLFVPVGYTLAGALLVDRGWRFALARATLLILPVSISVSLLVEFLQMFVGGRVPSNTDVAAQTIGCFGGITLWGLTGPAMTTWLRETFSTAAPADRLSRALTAFAFVWVSVGLAPFDITVDFGDLAKRVRSGKIAIVPFVGIEEPSKMAWDALVEVLSTIPLGAFGLIAWRNRGTSSMSTAWATGAAIVLFVEAAQIFIRSHSASSTDVLFGWTGVAVGVWAGRRFVPHLESTGGHRLPGGTRTAILAACAWSLVLCAYHWLPYDFVVDTEAIRHKLGRMSIVPFEGYTSGTYLSALSNLLTKVGLAVPFGLAAAYGWRGVALPRRLQTLITILTAATVFGAIEVGQFFLPARVPDPTDVLVGVAGAYAGLVLGGWLAA